MDRSILSVLCLMAALSAPLAAQSSASTPPIPQIVVGGHGDVKVSPDRATIQMSVQSHATTAAAAASENAKKQAAVIDAIKGLGIQDELISTTNYSVMPEQKYRPNEPPIVTGYSVTNTVVVEIRKISQVGAVIDAALAHGSNMIAGLSFYASNTDAARHAAIAAAVQNARGDADVAAKAAGGSLGELLEVSLLGGYQPPSPRPMMRLNAAVASEQMETPISPGEQSLTVDLSTRWRFIPPR